MADEDVSQADTHMPPACIPMMQSVLVPDGRAVVLLEREDGSLCLAVHPLKVSKQAVDEYNDAIQHAGRTGVGVLAPARPHPAV